MRFDNSISKSKKIAKASRRQYAQYGKAKPTMRFLIWKGNSGSSVTKTRTPDNKKRAPEGAQITDFPRTDYMLYARSPWLAVSSPSRSCSSLTRRPMVMSISLKAARLTTPDQRMVMPTPVAWVTTWPAMV